MIENDTLMLLFRFSNYKKYNFIEEHKVFLKEKGYVWMMKMGKKTSVDKLSKIKAQGGYIVLKSPIADGNRYYIGQFEDFQDEMPNDKVHMPQYYSEILEDIMFYDSPAQYFKLTNLQPLGDNDEDALRLEKSGKKVVDVINETRTAVMYSVNSKALSIDF